MLVALVVLGLIVVRLLGPVRRTSAAATSWAGLMKDDLGMIKARTAALRIRIAERRA